MRMYSENRWANNVHLKFSLSQDYTCWLAYIIRFLLHIFCYVTWLNPSSSLGTVQGQWSRSCSSLWPCLHNSLYVWQIGCWSTDPIINLRCSRVFLHLSMTKRGKIIPQRISGYTAPRNEIPTATPVFSGSGNSMALSGRLHLQTGSEKFKMAADNRMHLYLGFYTR